MRKNKTPTKTNKNQGSDKEVISNKKLVDIATSPAYNTSELIKQFRGFADTNFLDIMENMMDERKLVSQGNVEPLEKMLMHQAQALDTLFYHYASKIKRCEYLKQMEVYSQIAFKAQKQCRATITALVGLKSPNQTTFIKQQNNAVNQQINNNQSQPEEYQKQKIYRNELLELTDEHLDSKKTTTTISTHPAVETMGKVDRGKDS